MARCVAWACLLLALAQCAAAREYPNMNTMCESCLLSVHFLDDMLCDTYVDDKAAVWIKENICSQLGDNRATCNQLVSDFMPLAVEWIRANASPELLCANVCPKASLKAVAPPPRKSRNDMVCPLCMFVVENVKAMLTDPVTQEQIYDTSVDACKALPPGGMRDACIEWVEESEAIMFKYLNTMEPQGVCQMAGTCMDHATLRSAAPAAPLTPKMVAALSGLARVVTAAPSNDNCETCKVVIQQLHQVVANPDLQQQIVDYAKQACSVIPSVSSQCAADIDQYAPMVFGMLLAYLQPVQVCTQLHVCPAPSTHPFQAVQAQVALQATLAASKFKYVIAKDPAIATS